MYWLVAIYTFPLFSLVISSDQTCSDRTRGTLRFIALRTTRSEIIAGRFLGQLLIITILIALTLLATALMATYRDSGLLIASLSKGLHLFVELIFAVLPFIALMSFFNSFIRSSRLSIVVCLLFYCLASFIIILININVTNVDFLNTIFPGYQLSEVMGQNQFDIMNYVIPSVQTVVYLILTNIIMKRSSI
jgi:ABC-type transport system involved in multi-copper enzyme maturation permease subunit